MRDELHIAVAFPRDLDGSCGPGERTEPPEGCHSGSAARNGTCTEKKQYIHTVRMCCSSTAAQQSSSCNRSAQL
jgi:hypothetical protein